MDIRGLGDRWFAGQSVPGVAFGHNESVEITAGEYRGHTGSIVFLMDVEPEPLYLVELGTANGDVRIRQSALRALQ